MGQKQVYTLPKAPVGRILLNAGAKRVSADAVDAFTELLQSIAEQLSKQAVAIAEHAGRKTVQDSDVKLAKTNWKPQ